MPSWSETKSILTKESVLIALKECYGYLVMFGILIVIVIMLNSYCTQVTRLLPRMITIRKWMNTPHELDPNGTVVEQSNS